MSSNNPHITPNRLRQLRTMPYSDYLKTPEWTAKRKQALDRDGNSCRLCDKSEQLQVHHRTYVRRGNEDLNDLTTLCQPCHENFHEMVTQEALMERTQSGYASLPEGINYQEWEDYLNGLLISHPECHERVRQIMIVDCFTLEDTKALYLFLDATAKNLQPVTPIEKCIPADLLPVAERAQAWYAKKTFGGSHDYGPGRDAVQVSVRIKREYIKRWNKDWQQRMQSATDSGDKDAVQALLPEIKTIQQEMLAVDILQRGW